MPHCIKGPPRIAAGVAVCAAVAACRGVLPADCVVGTEYYQTACSDVENIEPHAACAPLPEECRDTDATCLCLESIGWTFGGGRECDDGLVIRVHDPCG